MAKSSTASVLQSAKGAATAAIGAKTITEAKKQAAALDDGQQRERQKKAMDAFSAHITEQQLAADAGALSERDRFTMIQLQTRARANPDMFKKVLADQMSVIAGRRAADRAATELVGTDQPGHPWFGAGTAVDGPAIYTSFNTKLTSELSASAMTSDAMQTRAAGMAKSLVEAQTTTSSAAAKTAAKALDIKPYVTTALTDTDLAEQAVQDQFEGPVKSSLAKVASAIDSKIKDPGKSARAEFKLSIPVDPTYSTKVELELVGEAQHDKPTGQRSVGFEVKVGGKVGFLDVLTLNASLGGYTKATAASTDGALTLISYGLYRKFRESSVLPREWANFIWGGGGADKKSGRYAQAELWASAVEQDWLKNKPLAGVEQGALGEAGARAGNRLLGGGVTARGTMGRRFTEESVARGKAGVGGLGKSFPTPSLRGAQPTLGDDVSGLSLKGEFQITGIGSVSASVSWTWAKSPTGPRRLEGVEGNATITVPEAVITAAKKAGKGAAQHASEPIVTAAEHALARLGVVAGDGTSKAGASPAASSIETSAESEKDRALEHMKTSAENISRQIKDHLPQVTSAKDYEIGVTATRVADGSVTIIVTVQSVKTKSVPLGLVGLKLTEREMKWSKTFVR